VEELVDDDVVVEEERLGEWNTLQTWAAYEARSRYRKEHGVEEWQKAPDEPDITWFIANEWDKVVFLRK
jgi:hypothetical protein